MALKDRLANLFREVTGTSPELPFPAVLLCRSLLSSLNEEKAWELSEGILKFAERIYQEMEAERREQIPLDVVDLEKPCTLEISASVRSEAVAASINDAIARAK